MMRSTFYGLNIATKGLSVAQRQIDVTSHNVANSNVQGYSRQRYITAADPPPGYASQFVDPTKGQVGDGVVTLTLDQIRDVFLDRQYRKENPSMSYWQVRSTAMYYVEDVFNANDNTSIDAIMSGFFNSLQELSKNPTDLAIRTNMVGEAKKLVSAFNSYHEQLIELVNQQDFNMVEKAKETNTILTNISKLNEKIVKYELGGSIANDLRDQRNNLLDQLSGMMDIAYQEVSFDPPTYSITGRELTMMRVYAGNSASEEYEDNLLISHNEAFHLIYEEETGLNETADNNELVIHSLKLASDVELNEVEGLESGMLLGYMTLRDSTDSDRPGIPYYIEQLNLLVTNFVETFNDIHNGGYTMPYSDVNGNAYSTLGVDFFDPDGLTADTIKLSDVILESAFNIAASLEYITLDEDGHTQTGNNLNALELISLFKEHPEVGSFEDFYKGFLADLASEASLANVMTQSQTTLMDSIEAQRLSVMGVSIDEEMTNLIRFQHAYNSSARAITTLDEMLDKLINGTGRVGL